MSPFDNSDRPLESIDESTADDVVVAPSYQPTRGQFDLVAMLSWTAVIAMHVSALRFLSISSADELVGGSILWLVFFVPASSCIPMLIRQLRTGDGHRMTGMERFRFIVFVAIYSVLALVLATDAFSPSRTGTLARPFISDGQECPS